MAITLRSSTNTARSTFASTDYTVSVGTVQLNDLMLMHLTVSVGSSITIGVPAGWTLIQSQGSSEDIRMYWKRAGASESNFDITRSANTFVETVVGVWYEPDGTPVTVDVSADQTNAVGDYDWPSITPTTAPGILLCFGTLNTDVTLTPPAGMTEGYEYQGATGTEPTLYMCSVYFTTAVALGARSASLDTGTNNSSEVVALALVATVDYGRVTDHRFFVDWDFNNTFTDESDNVIELKGEMAVAPPGQSITATQGIISRASVKLHNLAARYSQLRTDSALAADIADGLTYHAPCYVEISVDGGSNYDRVFTGVLKIPAETALAIKQPPTVTFEMRSNEERLLNKRISTLYTDLRDTHIAGGKTEDALIADFLGDAGLVAADYTLDSGMFSLPLVWLDDESVIEACWRLAAACGGRFYADPDGEFVYESMSHWLKSDHATVSMIISANNWQQMTPVYSDNELYKESEVVAVVYGIGDSSDIWEPREVISIPPNETKVVTAKLNVPAYEIESVTWVATTPAGSDITSDVTLTKTEYVKRVVLSFASTSSQTAYIASLKITGRPVLTENEVSRTATSAASFWTDRTGRTRRIANNKFVQTVQQADVLADFLKDRQQSPSLFIRVQGTKGDPALRMGSRVTITDPNTMTNDVDILLTRIDWQYSGGSFNQTLTGIDASSLFTYTAAEYFTIGTNKAGSTDALKGRLFY